jgi:hypothetical protein
MDHIVHVERAFDLSTSGEKKSGSSENVAFREDCRDHVNMVFIDHLDKITISIEQYGKIFSTSIYFYSRIYPFTDILFGY